MDLTRENFRFITAFNVDYEGRSALINLLPHFPIKKEKENRYLDGHPHHTISSKRPP